MRRGAWGRAVLAVGLGAAIGCAALAPGREINTPDLLNPRRTGENAAGESAADESAPGETPRNERVFSATDSVLAPDEALLDDGRLDGAAPAELAEAADDSRAIAPAVAPAKRFLLPGRVEIEAAAGPRSDAKFRFGGARGWSGGGRISGGCFSGFLRGESRWFVRGVHAGRLTVRGAERLILGRGMGAYGFAGMGPVRGGFAAAPSFSRWYAYPGLAVALGWGNWRADAVTLGRSESEDAGSPTTAWVSVSRRWDRGQAGVLAGWPVGPRADDALEEPVGRRAPRVGALYAAWSARGVEGSVEAAGVDERVFFAVRMTARNRRARSRWSVLFFEAPYESPLGPSGLEPVARTDRGVRFECARFFGPVGCEAVLVAGRTRSAARQTEYRRTTLVFSRESRSPLRWTACFLYKRVTEAVYPSNPCVLAVTEDGRDELRLRGEIELRSGAPFVPAVRLDYLPPTREAGPGVVMCVSTEFVSDRFDARIQTAAHSLPPGRSVVLWRPGVGPFEWLASFYGCGSDLALRARIRVAGGARVVVFYGSSWRAVNRAYAGVEYRR
jgi:hypothetical protein